ncbi:hypothetical protein FRC12_019513 [Ceratobasidium sp. 428]|nr:hypothetical protein FRC12_019513 [Ceratobasidium sp. 428]
MWNKLVEEETVGWHAQYICARTCQRLPNNLDEGEDIATPVPTKVVQPTGRRHSSTINVEKCPVQLHLEIHANDLKNVHIWMKHGHKDAVEGVVTWSRLVHLQAVNLSRNEGATAAQIRKSLLSLLKDKVSPNAVPDWRRPMVQDTENIMPASRRCQHYAKNAFSSLTIFAAQSCDRVFLYQPYELNGSKKLMCAVTDEFCLGSALLYANSNGLFMDATWRGMNQNYAPTTFLLAVDDKGHATPLSAFLSQDVQANTLKQFLKA